jgi:pimeloyl-ACP methyl ester carboxylesterase
MGDGAHLVGHSYGGLGVLFAAARRPEATLSLVLLEPGAFALGQHHPAGRALADEVRRGGEVAGRSPVDWGKQGTKRSVACDNQGIRCTWSRPALTITTRRCWSPP